MSALAPDVDVETALTRLVARQLVDAVGDGRIVLHEVVRVDVLAQLQPETKQRLSAAAAELVASTAAVSSGPRLAWQAGDDGAFGAMDQITRVREVVWHWLAAGNRDRADDTLLADRELAARSGGAGEFESLLDALGDPPRRRTESRPDLTTPLGVIHIDLNQLSARSQLVRGFAAQISNCHRKSAKLNSHLPLSLISHRNQNAPSIARSAAGAFGFLTLIQVFDSPDR